MLKINAMYFSPTGTTRKVVLNMQNVVCGENAKCNLGETIDITKLSNRNNEYTFEKDEVLIFGVPVYAGRVPNILLKFFGKIKADGAICIPIVLYGNRNYDDGLIELSSILIERGFNIIAAGAFIGEHSFSYKLAKGRPNESDMDIVVEFSKSIALKLSLINEADNNQQNYLNLEDIPGEIPFRNYYRPRDRAGNFFDFKAIKPITTEACNLCGICVDICPMQSISLEDPKKIEGICIKCGACIKNCPNGAKNFKDANYEKHRIELEEEYIHPNQIELFFS